MTAPLGEVRVTAPVSVQWERARVAELRAHLADIPDPVEYVYSMPDWMVAALLRSYQNEHVYLARHDDAQALRPFGLVCYGSRGLTAFGMAVRRALLEEDA